MKRVKPQSRLAINAFRSSIVPLLTLLVLALLATTYVSYNLSLRQLERKVQRLGTEHQSHLEGLLWQFDIDGLEARLQNFVELESIQRAVIVDSTGRLIEVGEQIVPGEPVVDVFMLSHGDGLGNTLELGTLTIEANRQEAWNTARRRALALIIIVSLSTLIIFTLIARQFNSEVLAPLVRISKRLRSSPQDWSGVKLDLGREKAGRCNDELDDLVDSIHEMRDQILLVREGIEEGEKRLAQAAQLAGLAYCTMDSGFQRIIECDEKYAAIHRKTVDEMLSLNLWSDIVTTLLDASDLPNAMQLRERILEGHDEIKTYRIQFENGEYLFIRQFFCPRHDDRGEVTAIQVVAQDVTDDILTRDILLQSQKIEAIGKLTGGVAHDFNNILAVIAGNLEMSITSSDSADIVARNTTALEAANRGANLTRQLLSFARKQPLSPVVVDAAKLIRDSVTLLRTSAGESIIISIHSDAQIWRTMADPVQLNAVLLNLVVNARDSMPNGGLLKIDISNAPLDAVYAGANVEVTEGDYVCIAVTDSGHGMTADTMQQAIEPFYTTKADGEGTGLGLSMAYGFARQSSGHLKIYSEIGEGTTVKLYLPRVHDDVAIVTPEKSAIHKSRLAGLNILLVEDNEQLRSVFTSQIESLGCIVHSAYDEISALALARRTVHVDIILTDIVLPGNADGRRVAEQLSAIYPDVATIYMSGFTENSISHEGQLENGISFLQKPFRLKDLTRCLSDALSVT